MNEFDEEIAALQVRDPRAFAAYGAAALAFYIDKVMEGESGDFRADLYWPRFGVFSGAQVGGIPTAEIAIGIEVLAPLVRQMPDVPGETLYRHAASAGVHDGPADGWPMLSIGQRSAFQAFSVVLTCLDELQARDDALAASQNPQIPRGEFVPIEDTILDTGHDATTLDKTLSEERIVTIIPGTGTPPGHAPAPRPAPPAIESNRVVKQPFMPTLTGPDGSDRTGHGTREPSSSADQPPPVAGAPGLDGGIAPGGAVPLGHGFDADAPFVPDAGPTQGPAVAVNSLADTTAVAQAPAEMTGTEDPQGVRNAPVLGGAPPAEPLAEDVHDDDGEPDEAEVAPKKRRRTRTKAERMSGE